MNIDFGAGKEPKETQKSCVNWYDYGARMYDPALARFSVIDNSAENYYSFTPYNYVGNNPIRRIDPDGNDWFDKVAGYAYGALTNVIPGSTALRNNYTPNDAADYNSALATSDAAAMVIGDVAQKGGAVIAAGGLTVAAVSGSATVVTAGVGAPVTVPVAGAALKVAADGVAISAAGTVVKANAANNAAAGYNYGSKETSNSKPASQTSSGRATDQHGNKLGPSGKPQVNTVKHSSPKAAKDAARNEGKGAPVKHTNPQKGGDHYHSTDRSGDKIPNSTHHEYPK